ncbi:MAG: 2-oxo acid dehydrogenase subunit E2 [Clostridia bacterium]|nr:2-oxo acid dehydrogenase subunit E2 [Clostridia bacterium]
MAIPVIMPRQGQSVESCILGKWHISVGDSVSAGDLLFTYETDKAVFDEAAPVGGVLLARFFEEGDDVPCLVNVCVIGQPGEDPAGFYPMELPESVSGASAPQPEPSRTDSSTGPGPVLSGASQGASGASPRARRLADRLGIDLRAGAAGTGPDGRILERDVRAAAEVRTAPTPAAGRLLADPAKAALSATGVGGRIRAADVGDSVPMPGGLPTEPGSEIRAHTLIRRSIGTAMMTSLGSTAQLTLNASFDATDLFSLRNRMKSARPEGRPDAAGPGAAPRIPTVTDFILYAVSRVLKRHPLLNAHGFEDHVQLFEPVHLGVAVDTPRGLMVPTVFHADRMELQEISKTVRTLADSCRSGAIGPDLLRGGTFTVTNLGAFGIESFTPVINPPQTAILGVCAPQTRWRLMDPQSGTASAYEAIPLSLTFDHRAMDGADAARFLQDLAGYMAEISKYLAE